MSTLMAEKQPTLSSMIRPGKQMIAAKRQQLRQAKPVFPAWGPEATVYGLPLEQQLIQHRDDTCFMRMSGNSMSGLGIYEGDLLVVDKRLPVSAGCLVIAVVDGELTVRQWLALNDSYLLRAAHPDYADKRIEHNAEISIRGVVSWHIKQALAA